MRAEVGQVSTDEETRIYEDYGIPKHPDADKLTVPKDDQPGQCICGAVLPPMEEWIDYPHQWTSFQCAECGRGYVDEDEFIAIYDEGLNRE